MRVVKSEAEVLLFGLDTEAAQVYVHVHEGGDIFTKYCWFCWVGISDLMPAVHHRSISALRKFSLSNSEIIFFGRSCAFTLL